MLNICIYGFNLSVSHHFPDSEFDFLDSFQLSIQTITNMLKKKKVNPIWCPPT